MPTNATSTSTDVNGRTVRTTPPITQMTAISATAHAGS
jgi:hypothetical protein